MVSFQILDYTDERCCPSPLMSIPAKIFLRTLERGRDPDAIFSLDEIEYMEASEFPCDTNEAVFEKNAQ